MSEDMAITGQGDGQIIGTYSDYDFHSDVMSEQADPNKSFLFTNDGHVIIGGRTKVTIEEFKKNRSKLK